MRKVKLFCIYFILGINLISNILDYCMCKSLKNSIKYLKNVNRFFSDIYDIGKYATKLKNIKLELNNEIKSAKDLITDSKRL